MKWIIFNYFKNEYFGSQVLKEGASMSDEHSFKFKLIRV